MHNIILSNTISNYTINHIKSSNIIKWLTVIQTKRERKREIERITKRNTNRLIKWKKEKENIRRVREGGWIRSGWESEVKRWEKD